MGSIGMPASYGTRGHERLLLYRTAIQTALRSSSLRGLTRGRLYLDADPPYITSAAGSNKNRKDARQYIHTSLAADLRAHIATKAPRAPVFNLPHETNLARMLRADLAEARKAWLEDAKSDPDEYAHREESDFLAATNHDGEVADFHCLKHTCGAWLAMSGAHPKVVQQVMQHSSITLTMDTYGHLFPGQEAQAVSGLWDTLKSQVSATGTDGGNQRAAYALHSGREAGPPDATPCDGAKAESAGAANPNSVRLAGFSDGVRPHAKQSKSRPGRIRTADQGIMSPLL